MKPTIKIDKGYLQAFCPVCKQMFFEDSVKDMKENDNMTDEQIEQFIFEMWLEHHCEN